LIYERIGVTRSEAPGKTLRGKLSEEKLKYENAEGKSPGVVNNHWIKEDRCQQIFHSRRYPVIINEKLRFEIFGVQRPEGDLDR
jgi:hypothetical protein